MLDGFKYKKLLNISIWPINGTLKGSTMRDQSGPKSNDNEGVLHTPQNSWAGASPSDSRVLYPEHSFVVSITPLQRRNFILQSLPTGQ